MPSLDDIAEIFVGSAPVAAVYVGSTLVWPLGGGGEEVIFGEETIGGESFPCNEDRCMSSRFVLTEDVASVESIFVHFDAATEAGCNLKCAIHTDAAGPIPATVLIKTSATAIPAGASWVECIVTTSVPLAAGTYWISAVTDSFQAYFTIHEGSGAMHMANGSYSYATLPNWPGSDAEYESTLSAYAKCST